MVAVGLTVPALNDPQAGKGDATAMARSSTQPNFAQLIRERRGQLNLTQQEVGRRIKVSTQYIGHLESGIRHPSDKILTRLSEVLGLDAREIFVLANPWAKDLVAPSVEVGQELGLR